MTRSTENGFETVDAGLEPGVHRFRLVVEGASGRVSKPDDALVEISADRRVGPEGVLPEHTRTPEATVVGRKRRSKR